MSGRYETYGFRAATLEAAAALVQSVLGIVLSERDSAYYAGRYYSYDPSYGRELKLYSNYDEITGTWVREVPENQHYYAQENGLATLPKMPEVYLDRESKP